LILKREAFISRLEFVVVFCAKILMFFNVQGVSMQEQLNRLIEFVRLHSPYYRELYANLPKKIGSLEELPPVDKVSFWKANTFKNNRILTGPMDNGIVFKSGGTTAKPKFSVYSNSDWQNFTGAFGRGMRSGGLQPGERIGNLFYGGELYASLLFITRCVEEAGTGVLYPIAGATKLEDMVKIIRDYQLETLAGLPTTLLKLAEFVQRQGINVPVTKLLYGGEPAFSDQIRLFENSFGPIRVQSIGIASVDGGEFGYVDPTCSLGEHRCFDTTVMELLDDGGEVIRQENIPGTLYSTNLHRRLMPIIRYPVGDRAMWVEPEGSPNRKYHLLGRAGYAARIGAIEFSVDMIDRILKEGFPELEVESFQIVTFHRELADGVILRIALAEPKNLDPALEQQLIDAVYRERKMYPQELAKGHVHPMEIHWVHMDQLVCNTRTGKILRVVDERGS
jgi:phenylacetate-CoA ligase